MAKYKVAYGGKDDITKNISLGTIPPGTIILTDDSNEIYFYDLERKLRTYKEKSKFNSKSEAEEWIKKYNCKGNIVSVHEEDKCNLYLVDYNDNLVSIESEGAISCIKQDLTEEQKNQARENQGLYYERTILKYQNDNALFSSDNNITISDVDIYPQIGKIYCMEHPLKDEYLYGTCSGDSRYDYYIIEFKDLNGMIWFTYDAGDLKWNNSTFSWEEIEVSIRIYECEIFQVEDKFIPSNIPKVATAEVGQILEVESIDENGRPLSFKAIDNISDWNTMQNKPFGTSLSTKDIVKDGKVSINEASMANGGVNFEVTDGVLEVGKEYSVIWDGLEYTCVAQKINASSSCIGNFSLTGGYFPVSLPGTNEPFCVVSSVYSNGYDVSASEAGEHVFSISESVENVHTLDPKYIKDMYHEYDEVTDISGYERSFLEEFNSSSLYECDLEEELPLELGQKWEFYYGGDSPSSKYGVYEVQMSDDGELYFGTPTVDDVPFCVTKNHIKLNSSFKYQMNVYVVKLVCAEGSITETRVKQVDSKYIKDMYYSKNNEYAILENQTLSFITSEMSTYLYTYGTHSLEFDPNKKYKVIIDSEEASDLEVDNNNLLFTWNGSTECSIDPSYLALNKEGCSKLSIYEIAEEIKKIDEKYLPYSEENPIPIEMLPKADPYNFGVVGITNSTEFRGTNFAGNLNRICVDDRGYIYADAIPAWDMSNFMYTGGAAFIIKRKGSSDIALNYPCIGWWGVMNRGYIDAYLIDTSGVVYKGNFNAQNNTWSSVPTPLYMSQADLTATVEGLAKSQVDMSDKFAKSLVQFYKDMTQELSAKITTPNTAEVGQVLSVNAIDENGKPTEWETVPVDWNTMQNKPFYDNIEELVLVDDELNNVSQSSNNYMAFASELEQFVIGDSYTLYVNGENKGTVIHESNTEGLHFGSGYSEFIVFLSGINNFAGDGKFHVKLVRHIVDFKQIDEKYLPESVKTQSDWNEEDETSPAYIHNKPETSIFSFSKKIEDIHRGYQSPDKYSVILKNSSPISSINEVLDAFEKGRVMFEYENSSGRKGKAEMLGLYIHEIPNVITVWLISICYIDSSGCAVITQLAFDDGTFSEPSTPTTTTTSTSTSTSTTTSTSTSTSTN